MNIKGKLPAKPLGFIALVVVGSIIANRFHSLVVAGERKVKKLMKVAVA
ncbi:MAG: hypothetical protein JXR40_03880 [Pontiellaceae bacterium]|nr:hypothetical protein [Pontiellaceae bacterium]